MDPSKVVNVRNAVPLDGNVGGIRKYIIPNGLENGAIKVTQVLGLNPAF